MSAGRNDARKARSATRKPARNASTAEPPQFAAGPVPWFICARHADCFFLELETRLPAKMRGGGVVVVFPSTRTRYLVKRDRGGGLSVWCRHTGALLLQTYANDPRHLARYRG